MANERDQLLLFFRVLRDRSFPYVCRLSVSLSSLCIRLNEMVAATAANLGKLNGRDKSLHKTADVGLQRTRGTLLAVSGDPVFGGRDGECEWGLGREILEGETCHCPPAPVPAPASLAIEM